LNQAVLDRWFSIRDAFEHPVVLWASVGVVAALVTASVVVMVLVAMGRLDDTTRTELRQRIMSWCVLAPLMIGPILLGAAWTILSVLVLSLLCYSEYARVTGLFREKLLSLLVVMGILAISFAVVDHWYGFFMALGPLTMLVISALAILSDKPKGYVQRVALGVFAFFLFGMGLGHLGYFANDEDYRPILVLILLSVELNDVFAYMSGKMLGRRKLCPQTSPNKTIGGAAGALILTTTLVAVVGHYVFADGVMDSPGRLIGLGMIISIAGQFGDLMLSSIKRDVGIKDTGTVLPGHGGLLDRFDSLLLVAPAVFHYIGYFRGIGLDQPVRILTGGAG
jgi:phosphatidate cytidylyltransferase